MIPSPTIAAWRLTRLEAQLAEHGLMTAPLSPPREQRVLFRHYASRWRNAVANASCQTLGLELGAREPMGRWGVLEYLLMSSANLRTAIHLADRFWPLIAEAQSFRIDNEGPEVRLLLSSPVPGATGARQIVESELAYISSFVRRVHGPLADPMVLWLRRDHAFSQCADHIGHRLGVSVQTGAQEDGLGFRTSLLERPLATAAPTLHRTLVEQVESLAVELKSAETTNRALSKLLHRHELRLDLAAAARALGMSERTLQRRLTIEGTSWRQVRDQVRRALAIEWLQSDCRPLEEIAYALGFSAPRAFFRAFRRWTGHTPSAFRAARPASRIKV